MATTSLRDRQVAAIQRVLALNAPIESRNSDDVPAVSESDEPVFKVLVFDDFGRDCISSVLRVHDLRAAGVTIHLNINTTRHLIPDVPVIYLVEPTMANLQLIASDLQRGLYAPAYINFLSSIPRQLLEDFGGMIAAAGTGEHIASVFDQHLNFIVAENDLFSLEIEGAYGTLNSARTTDQDVDALIDRIVSGLFSVCVTMQSIPIIRCPQGGAAELVSAKLDRKLRDHVLNSKNSLFSGSDQKSSAVASRPVLIIADRNIDLIPLLSHSWQYQSLISDLLTIKLNKITVTVPVDEDKPEKGTKKQSYDLTSSDYFWAANSTKPFPDVAEDIDKELKKYEEEASAVTKQTGASSIDELGGAGSVAAHLKGALALLPELKERKATLTMHMNILKSLISGIETRKVHEYFQMEEEITKQTKAQILDTIKSPEKGNDPTDRLRFFMIWYLATEQELSRQDLDNFTQALQAAGADTAPLNYIKTVRQLTRMSMISSAPAQPTQNSSVFHGFSSLSSRVTDRFKDVAGGANFEGLLSGIKNLIPQDKDLTLTKVTESIMDPQNASSSAISKTEGYLYFDPRSANARGTVPQANQRNQPSTVGRGIEASFGQRRQGYSEAIVFTVGGGSMDEYGNLQEWAKRTSGGGASGTGQKKRVIYGSTALLSASEFLKDLEMLGKESS